MNIAIFSPNKNPYSETFIQAHKTYLKGRVFYYFGYKGYIRLEQVDKLVTETKRLQYRIVGKLNKYPNFYVNEQSILDSLKKNAIDVILVEYGTHAFSLKKVLIDSGLPVIVHFHGYDASIKTVIEKCQSYKDVFALSSSIIAVSRKMEQMLLDIGCPREKLVYNACGPQSEFEILQPTFAKKQFIGIGRFIDKKAPYYTILAFKEVVKAHPDVHLYLAGEGTLLNTCKNLVKHLKLDKHVTFLGVITPEYYRELLSSSLAFVQHSITADNGDMEGTPVALSEASIAGLPVISTYHAGIPDVIVHGKTGLLCHEHDVGDMANNMLQVLNDKELAKKMGASGKQYMLENFNLDKHIKILQNLLEQAVLGS